MVSRVGIIVFIIRGIFFEVYGEKREVQNRKRSVFRGVDYSTNFLRKALEINSFQVSDQKIDGK